MRVLHLNAGNMFGGVETVLVSLALNRHLIPEMEPEFALCFPGRLNDELLAAKVPVHDMLPVRLSRPWTVLRARRRLAVLLAERRIDVVVAHGCWSVAIFSPTVRKARSKLVYWAHDAGLTPEARAGRYGWIEWIAQFSPPHLTLAISEFTRPYASAVFPAVPCEYVRYPIDLNRPIDKTEARRTVRQELGTSPTDVVIVQVSRMVAYKGQRLLLEAIGGLRVVPGWKVWFVGGPQNTTEELYFAELQATAAKLGVLEHVKFLGTRSDIPRILAAADIHCQPNTGPELFGITFIEGLAAGLCVVSTSIGAAVEILGSGAGLLVSPDSPAELRDVLHSLIEKPEMRQRYSSTGPARAAELCDPGRQTRQIADLLAANMGRNALKANCQGGR